MPKKFYIKERRNPQFDKPYYVPKGQMSKADAKRFEKCTYGSVYMQPYNTEEEYNAAIEELKKRGFNVHK